MDYGFTSIPAIACICYLLGELIKVTKIDNKWIPVICGGAGAILGVAAMYVMPGYPGRDIITAAAIGIFSGGGATWANQIYKQLHK